MFKQDCLRKLVELETELVQLRDQIHRDTINIKDKVRD